MTATNDTFFAETNLGNPPLAGLATYAGALVGLGVDAAAPSLDARSRETPQED